MSRPTNFFKPALVLCLCCLHARDITAAPAVAVVDEGFTLSQALDALRRAHPALRAAANDITAARGDAIDAGLWQNPLLQVAYAKSTGFTTYDPRRGYSQIGAAQYLEIAGTPTARRAMAERTVDATRSELRALEVSLANGVIQAVIDLGAVHHNLAVFERFAVRFEDARRIMQERVDAGAAPRYDATRMGIAAAQALADRDQALAEVSAAHARLVIAVGPAGAELLGPPRFDLFVPLPTIAVDLLAIERDHPAVQAARQRAAAATAGVRVARRAVWPGFQVTFGIGVGAGYDLQQRRTQFDITGGVNVPLPVLDRGQGSVPAARARARAAGERADATLAATALPLADLARHADARRHAERAYDERLSGLRGVAVAEAMAGYRDGKLSILEVVDAYQSERDLELRAIDLAARARSAELQLWDRAGRVPPL